MKTPIIQIKHLKYYYQNDKQPAINDVNLDIFSGQWVSLIGLNGSGKSTLVKLIDGLIPKTSGQIWVDKSPLSPKTLMSIRSKIGIVFQNPQDQFVGATVKDEIAFGLENQQVPSAKIKQLIHWSLSVVGMLGYQNTLIDHLSGGQQQRIAIADVIVMKPKILILDEATSMLDPQGRIKILHLIRLLKKQLHLTVINITHDVNETVYAQIIAVMDQGKIVMKGTPSEVFSRQRLLRKLHLGIPSQDVLMNLLKKRGIPVPDHHITEAGMLEWLHKLFLKM